MESLPPLGEEHTLTNTDIEAQAPEDLSCYCERCQYKRCHIAHAQANLQYGFAFFGMWLYNLQMYVHSKRLSNQYVFSDSIPWEYPHEAILAVDPDDDTTLVGALIRQHDRTNSTFDKLCGWSLLAILTEMVFIWMVVMAML